MKMDKNIIHEYIKNNEPNICQIIAYKDNKVVYEDKRIVSENYIDEMVKPKTVESEWFRGMHYGYLWWIVHPEDNIYAAIGNSGNVIYINPKENLVVSVASYFKPTVFDRVDFIEDYLINKIIE